MIQHFFWQQLERWPLARQNYNVLKEVQTENFRINNCTMRVQYNPARIISSNANTDKKHIETRKCFLCPANLSSDQTGILVDKDFQLLINPYPIFPRHFTIPHLLHVDQHILPYVDVLYHLVNDLPGYVIFYNGPRCGASAPDHMHFQAGNIDFLPFISEYKKEGINNILSSDEGSIGFYSDGFRAAFIIEASNKKDGIVLFHKLYDALPKSEEDEPLLNLLSWKENDKWVMAVFPRKCHRPSCFYRDNEYKITISPATVDMGGVIIVPLEKDYRQMTPELIEEIFKEVTLSESECNSIIDQLVLNP